MAKRTVFFMLCLTIFILLSISAQAEPPHDASNDVSCIPYRCRWGYKW